MAETVHESKMIGPVAAVRSSAGQVPAVRSEKRELVALTQPNKASRPASESEPSAHTVPEVAVPDLGKMLDDLSPHLNIGVTYVIDRETHNMIIQVIDRDTNEVLRQIPPEEMRKLGAVLRDNSGLLFKAMA